MSPSNTAVEQATIRQYCKTLRMPTIASQFATLAEQATREKHSYTRYLEALLAMEVEEREPHTVARRIQDARLPGMKTIDDFDFSQSLVPATRIRELADGGYIQRAEPVVLIGECGTGKTHLATALVWPPVATTWARACTSENRRRASQQFCTGRCPQRALTLPLPESPSHVLSRPQVRIFIVAGKCFVCLAKS